jgi:hypothetical protein
MSKVLGLQVPAERFYVIAAGLQRVVGMPDTPSMRKLLEGKRFKEVVFTSGDESVRLRCVRVFFDPHTKELKWRIELGEVLNRT